VTGRLHDNVSFRGQKCLLIVRYQNICANTAAQIDKLM
jgi:hypothetical protein